MLQVVTTYYKTVLIKDKSFNNFVMYLFTPITKLIKTINTKTLKLNNKIRLNKIATN